MPNPIIATCPSCQKRLKANPEIVGKQVRCPSCKNPFVVQAGSSKPVAGTPQRGSSQVKLQPPVNPQLPPNPGPNPAQQQTVVPCSAGTQASWGQQTPTGKQKPTGKGKRPPINKGLLIGLSALGLILLVGIGYFSLQFFAQGKNQNDAKNVASNVPKNVTETKKEKTPPKKDPIPKKSPKVFQPRTVTPAFNGPEDVDGVALSDLPTYESATDKETLTKWFDYQKSVLKKSPDRPGFLVVGRVQLEDGADPKLVNSQDRIHTDGTFVHITRDLKRPFGLRAHGYEPVDIELKGCQGAVVDVGTIQLNKLPNSELRTLKGKLIADEGGAFQGATIELKIRTGPQNTFGGTRPFGGERLTIPVASDGTFVLEGFSPAIYAGTVSVPGYVPQNIRPDFKNPDGGSLGDIKLEKQLVIQLEFMEAKAGAAFGDASRQETKLLGGAEWKLGGDRYPTLLVVQENGALKEFRTRMSGTGYKDLGVGQLQDFLNVERPTEGLSSAQPVTSGHVYLAYVKHRKCHVLFRVGGIKSVPLDALPATAVNRPVLARQIMPEFTGPKSLNDVRLSELPSYRLAQDKDEFQRTYEARVKKLEREQTYLESRKMTGHIVMGRVALEDQTDPSLIQAQYTIAKDGTFLFVTPTLSRPIGFRMHQYEAVDVALKNCSGKVVDVGTITLKKLPSSQLRSVKGKIVLEGSTDASVAQLRLQVALPPLNSIRSTNFGMRRTAIAYEISTDGSVSASGFSPTKYYGTVTAPGYERQYFYADVSKTTVVDFGQIKLEKSKDRSN